MAARTAAELRLSSSAAGGRPSQVRVTDEARDQMKHWVNNLMPGSTTNYAAAFAGGQLITLFSATNYCGTANNAGAILVVGRDLMMVPKLIHPAVPESRSPRSAGNGAHDSLPANGAADMAWMQVINEERPPTPPRGRPGAQANSLAYF